MVNDFATTLQALERHLGSALLAVIAGTTTDQIARWSIGDEEPTPDTAERVRATADILECIMRVDAAPVARAWLMGAEPGADQSRAEDVADGRTSDVWAAARAFVGG
jgi:hypothetical protein